MRPSGDAARRLRDGRRRGQHRAIAPVAVWFYPSKGYVKRKTVASVPMGQDCGGYRCRIVAPAQTTMPRQVRPLLHDVFQCRLLKARGIQRRVRVHTRTITSAKSFFSIHESLDELALHKDDNQDRW